MKSLINVVELTKLLISYNTTNPPGNEYAISKYIGNLLFENGFKVDYPELSKERLHVIAEKGLDNNRPPIVFSGHMDVVPIGAKKWNSDPFVTKESNGKLYGRGTSDMKAGVAAMICAAIEVFEGNNSPEGGVKLIITAGEEHGCHGIRDLFNSKYNIGHASGLIVGEPTSNEPYIGHKGGLFLNAYAHGVTAHSSMPELGENAIYKVARAISKIEKFQFSIKQDKLLGYPTINVGVVSGGLNFNSVPDKAEFTIDVRTTSELENEKVLDVLKNEIGNEITIEPFVNLGPVSTPEESSFVQMVYKTCESLIGNKVVKKSIGYLTDASVLQPWLKGVPTIILGPGEPDQAHQTDEFCYLDKIEQAVKIYKEIIINNQKLSIDGSIS